MHIVDIHPHVIATDHARYPLAPVGGKLSEWAARRPVTCEQLLAAMDEAGVAQAALVQASTAHGHDNRYSADCAAAHPDHNMPAFAIYWGATFKLLPRETPPGRGGPRVRGDAPRLGRP
ncbi:MAG TPA: hypothetical protein VFE37_04170 [Chloroflexota bacterium]|nr:hypothetical protein [Chloroflexota bacterium]